MKVHEILTEQAIPGLVLAVFPEESGWVAAEIEELSAFDPEMIDRFSAGDEVSFEQGVEKMLQHAKNAAEYSNNFERDRQIIMTKIMEFKKMLSGHSGTFKFAVVQETGHLMFTKQDKILQFPKR